MQTTTISQKGQIVIPKSIREELQISASDRFTVNLKGRTIIVEPVPSTDAMFGAFPAKIAMTDKEMKETIKTAVRKKHSQWKQS